MFCKPFIDSVHAIWGALAACTWLLRHWNALGVYLATCNGSLRDWNALGVHLEHWYWDSHQQLAVTVRNREVQVIEGQSDVLRGRIGQWEEVNINERQRRKALDNYKQWWYKKSFFHVWMVYWNPSEQFTEIPCHLVLFKFLSWIW